MQNIAEYYLVEQFLLFILIFVSFNSLNAKVAIMQIKSIDWFLYDVNFDV